MPGGGHEDVGDDAQQDRLQGPPFSFLFRFITFLFSR